MPNRIIKESICESENLNNCSIWARELFTRLITYADDYGRFNADMMILRSRLYPRHVDQIGIAEIEEWLIELTEQNLIQFYAPMQHMIERVKLYGQILTWEEHQRVRDSRPKCPVPDNDSWCNNDWFYRRAISVALKDEILRRDNYTCQICGFKLIFPENYSDILKRRNLQGLLHIDHIIPVTQGGRATTENLRVLCGPCNERRPRKLSVEYFGEACADLPPFAEISRLNPNPNPESKNESKSEEPTGNKLPFNPLDCCHSFEDYKNLAETYTDKVAFLVTVFKKLHSNAPDIDFERCGGRLAGMYGKKGKDYGYILKVIWNAATQSIAGSHLDYIDQMLFSKNNQSKAVKPMVKSTAEVNRENQERIEKWMANKQ